MTTPGGAHGSLAARTGQMADSTDKSAQADWVVLKYGGTSVGEAANWPGIAEVLRERQAAGLRPVLVHSALAGVRISDCSMVAKWTP